MPRVLAIAALAVALVVFLATTGPSPETHISGSIRRLGGVCLTLERWGLLGWQEVGASYTVNDIQTGTWHRSPGECADVPQQTYLVRPPFDASNGSYRICGVGDDIGCIEFEKIEFVSDGPGP